MTKAIILLLMASSMIAASAKELYKDSQVSVSELKPGVAVMETWDNTTMYLVEGSERALLIDTGTKCDSLAYIVKKLTDKPVDVVITHLHPDHAGCAGQFESFHMHPLDSVMLGEYNFSNTIHYINDGHKFDLGGGKIIEALLMPGHTPGSIVLLDRANGDCFSGDAFGSGGVWLQLEHHIPMVSYLGSCHRMLQLMDEGSATQLWVGHYPYTKRSFDKAYMEKMTRLAARLTNNDESGSKEYTLPPSIHNLGKARFIVEDGVSIVYNSEKIN